MGIVHSYVNVYQRGTVFKVHTLIFMIWNDVDIQILGWNDVLALDFAGLYRCFSMQSEPILPSYSWMLVCRFPPLNWGNSPKTRWWSTHRSVDSLMCFACFFTFPSGKIQRISGEPCRGLSATGCPLCGVRPSGLWCSHAKGSWVCHCLFKNHGFL